MRFDVTSLAIVFGIILALGALQAWLIYMAKRRLHRWAENNRLTILKEQEAGLFRRGPFTWTTGRTDFVFRLTVRDTRGELFEGWARVRGLYFGDRRPPVEAKWVDGSPALVQAMK